MPRPSWERAAALEEEEEGTNVLSALLGRSALEDPMESLVDPVVDFAKDKALGAVDKVARTGNAINRAARDLGTFFSTPQVYPAIAVNAIHSAGSETAALVADATDARGRTAAMDASLQPNGNARVLPGDMTSVMPGASPTQGIDFLNLFRNWNNPDYQKAPDVDPFSDPNYEAPDPENNPLVGIGTKIRENRRFWMNEVAPDLTEGQVTGADVIGSLAGGALEANVAMRLLGNAGKGAKVLDAAGDIAKPLTPAQKGWVTRRKNAAAAEARNKDPLVEFRKVLGQAEGVDGSQTIPYVLETGLSSPAVAQAMANGRWGATPYEVMQEAGRRHTRRLLGVEDVNGLSDDLAAVVDEVAPRIDFDLRNVEHLDDRSAVQLSEYLSSESEYIKALKSPEVTEFEEVILSGMRKTMRKNVDEYGIERLRKDVDTYLQTGKVPGLSNLKADSPARIARTKLIEEYGAKMGILVRNDTKALRAIQSDHRGELISKFKLQDDSRPFLVRDQPLTEAVPRPSPPLVGRSHATGNMLERMIQSGFDAVVPEGGAVSNLIEGTGPLNQAAKRGYAATSRMWARKGAHPEMVAALKRAGINDAQLNEFLDGGLADFSEKMYGLSEQQRRLVANSVADVRYFIDEMLAAKPNIGPAVANDRAQVMRDLSRASDLRAMGTMEATDEATQLLSRYSENVVKSWERTHDLTRPSARAGASMGIFADPKRAKKFATEGKFHLRRIYERRVESLDELGEDLAEMEAWYRSTNPKLNKGQIRRKMENDLTARHSDDIKEISVTAGGAPTPDMRFLRSENNIPEAMRKYMGEVTAWDDRVNSMMGPLIDNVYDDLTKRTIQRVLESRGALTRSAPEIQQGWKKVAYAPGNLEPESFWVRNELVPLIEDSLVEMKGKSWQRSVANGWDHVKVGSALWKMSVTRGAPLHAGISNAMSNVTPAMMAGAVFRGEFYPAAARSLQQSIRNIVAAAKGKSLSPAHVASHQAESNLVRRGLANQGVLPGEIGNIEHILNARAGQDQKVSWGRRLYKSTSEKIKGNKITGPAWKGFDQFYAEGDTFWKRIMVDINDKDFKAAYEIASRNPEDMALLQSVLGYDDFEKASSEFILNEFQNYQRTSAFVNGLSAMPGLSPFASFPYEAWRNFGWSYKHLGKELRIATEATDPALAAIFRKRATARIAGQTAGVEALDEVLNQTLSYMYGDMQLTEQDKDVFDRRLLADYQRGGKKKWVGADYDSAGELILKYVDTSRLDYFSDTHKAIDAVTDIFEDQDPESRKKSIEQLLGSTFGSFAGYEGWVSGAMAVLGVNLGQDPLQDLYRAASEGAPWGPISREPHRKDRVKAQLYQGLERSMGTQVRRGMSLGRALTGIEDAYGRPESATVGEAAAATVNPLRVTRVNVPGAFARDMYRHTKPYKDIQGIAKKSRDEVYSPEDHAQSRKDYESKVVPSMVFALQEWRGILSDQEIEDILISKFQMSQSAIDGFLMGRPLPFDEAFNFTEDKSVGSSMRRLVR